MIFTVEITMHHLRYLLPIVIKPMLDLKLVQLTAKVSPKVANEVLLKNAIYNNCPKKVLNSWAIFEGKFVTMIL